MSRVKIFLNLICTLCVTFSYAKSAYTVLHDHYLKLGHTYNAYKNTNIDGIRVDIQTKSNEMLERVKKKPPSHQRDMFIVSLEKSLSDVSGMNKNQVLRGIKYEQNKISEQLWVMYDKPILWTGPDGRQVFYPVSSRSFYLGKANFLVRGLSFIAGIPLLCTLVLGYYGKCLMDLALTGYYNQMCE